MVLQVKEQFFFLVRTTRHGRSDRFLQLRWIKSWWWVKSLWWIALSSGSDKKFRHLFTTMERHILRAGGQKRTGAERQSSSTFEIKRYTSLNKQTKTQTKQINTQRQAKQANKKVDKDTNKRRKQTENKQTNKHTGALKQSSFTFGHKTNKRKGANPNT